MEIRRISNHILLVEDICKKHAKIFVGVAVLFTFLLLITAIRGLTVITDTWVNSTYVNATNNIYASYVGIGTMFPVQVLDVVGTINATTSVYSPIYYDSSGTTYYLDPSNSGTSLNVAGKATLGANATNGMDVVTKSYGDAHYSPGGWSCTRRTGASGASSSSVSCSGSEKVINGGCLNDYYTTTYPCITFSYPSDQGWVCSGISCYVNNHMTSYANCCT